MTAPHRAPAVYRARAHRLRQRTLLGLAGAALLLIGYGLGRWQDTPTPAATLPAAALPSATQSAAGPSLGPTPTQPSSAPPTPTVYPTLQAEAASALTGIQTQSTEDQGGGQNVGWIATGDSMRYDGVDFGPVPATKLLVRVAAGSDDGGRMEVRLDGAAQPPVGVLTAQDTGGWQNWRTDEITLSTPVTGKHTVFLTFTGNKDSEFLNINWLQFEH